MKVYEYTNKGSRKENQDYIIHGSLPEGAGVYIIADGMGGYNEGAIASKAVAEAILDYVELNYGKTTPSSLLKEAIFFANDALMLKRMALAAKKMGCVITILLIMEGYAHFSWLGDSRLYMFRNGQEVYMTEDHSILNELSKIKALPVSSMEKYTSIVTKSIMGEETIDKAPIAKVEIQKGDVFVLCTDGFHKEIDIMKAFEYDDSKKEELESIAESIADNFSFIKVEI